MEIARGAALYDEVNILKFLQNNNYFNINKDFFALAKTAAANGSLQILSFLTNQGVDLKPYGHVLYQIACKHKQSNVMTFVERSIFTKDEMSSLDKSSIVFSYNLETPLKKSKNIISQNPMPNSPSKNIK